MVNEKNLGFGDKLLVSIIAGSTSDKDVYEKAERVLKEYSIDYELKILSAHRNPEKLDDYIKIVRLWFILL